MIHIIDYKGHTVAFHADYFYTHPIKNIKGLVKKYNSILDKGYVFSPLPDGDDQCEVPDFNKTK